MVDGTPTTGRTAVRSNDAGLHQNAAEQERQVQLGFIVLNQLTRLVIVVSTGNCTAELAAPIFVER